MLNNTPREEVTFFQCFRRPRPQSPVILDLCLRKTRSGKSHDYRDAIVFEKLRFQNVFRPHGNAKSGVFKFLRVEERFRKDSFSWRISMDGRPNHINKAALSFLRHSVGAVLEIVSLCKFRLCLHQSESSFAVRRC